MTLLSRELKAARGDMNEVYGLWVRSHRGKLQVLVETHPGEWRQVFLEAFDASGGTTSHIIGPAGVRNSPFVDTDGDFNPR